MNIIKALEKEIDKGNDFTLANGEIVDREKLEKIAKKNYLELAKAGDIDIAETSFEEYFTDFCTNEVSRTEELTIFVQGFVDDISEHEEFEPDTNENLQ